MKKFILYYYTDFLIFYRFLLFYRDFPYYSNIYRFITVIIYIYINFIELNACTEIGGQHLNLLKEFYNSQASNIANSLGSDMRGRWRRRSKRARLISN